MISTVTIAPEGVFRLPSNPNHNPHAILLKLRNKISVDWKVCIGIVGFPNNFKLTVHLNSQVYFVSIKISEKDVVYEHHHK